jgi:hypothetical protein
MAAEAGTLKVHDSAAEMAWDLVQALATAFADGHQAIQQLRAEADEKRRFQENVAAADGLACPVCFLVFGTANSKIYHMQSSHASYRNCNCSYKLLGG